MATPSHHPHRVGGWWRWWARESAARSFCSSGSQAQLATVYECAVPNFAACSSVVQQHDYGKDHRGTLPAEAPRAIAAEESTTGMANETFKMGALRHPYGAGRATGGHARPRRPGIPHVATLGGHVAQLNGGQAAKKAAVEAQISRTGRDGAYLHCRGANCPNRPANQVFLSRTTPPLPASQTILAGGGATKRTSPRFGQRVANGVSNVVMCRRRWSRVAK